MMSHQERRRQIRRTLLSVASLSICVRLPQRRPSGRLCFLLSQTCFLKQKRPDEDQRYGFTEELTERAEDGRATGTAIDLLAFAAAEPKLTVQSDSVCERL